MNFLKSSFLLSSIFMLSSIAVYSEAKTTPVTRTYKLSSDIQWIQIQAKKAHVQIMPAKTISHKKKSSKTQLDTKPEEMKIQYEGNFKVSSEDEGFYITERGFSSRHGENKVISNKEKMSVTVWLPAQQSLRVLAVSGRVEIQNIQSSNLSVSMLSEGSIKVQNTKGNLNIFQGRGIVDLSSYKGDLKLHAENSRISMNNCHGNMEIRSFKGRLNIKKSSGKLFINTFKTPVILGHFDGHLTSRQEKGGLYLKPMTGSIQAYSEEAEIQGQLYPDTVDIETKKGAITLDMPGSRAWLSMESWEGRIKSPPYFYRSRTGGLNRARGRLRGKSKNKGEVTLKSHSGSIRVYQSSD